MQCNLFNKCNGFIINNIITFKYDPGDFFFQNYNIIYFLYSVSVQCLMAKQNIISLAANK